jgi:uncharacterized ferritin-like protein (DUF455 family)
VRYGDAGGGVADLADPGAFAWRVLTATTLADKLRPPSGGDPPPGALPTVPGRPLALQLGRSRRGGRAPTPAGIHDDRDRARVLHAMANHELLALELFAWAILRFPDVPAPHRRAFAHTMQDEQRHLAAYLDRLHTTGVELGSEPVSTFFWDALSPVDEPRAFVAGLSLCLEQANLDFALAWSRTFARAGDPETAAVLRDVHEDEVRHVRAGLATWSALGGGSGFDDFAAALPPPLTPARARGPALDREGRRRAGLPDAFVDALAIAGGSRGRVPRLVELRPNTEDELAGRVVAALPELRQLGLWMAAAEDVVRASAPSPAFLAGLARQGFPVPAFVGDDDPLPEVSGHVAWAEGPWTEGWDPRRRAVHGKAFAAECLRAFLPRARLGLEATDCGVVCATVAEVAAALGPEPHLVKADLSTAGGHRVELAGGWGAASHPARAFVDRALALGPVVVERRLPVAAELSLHVTVEADGSRRIDGLTRFVAHRGVYRGTVLGPPSMGLDRSTARFLHGDGRDEDAVHHELAAASLEVCRRAAALGHRGPLSIDALLLDAGDGRRRLKPISEVNPRWTMSRVALQLHRRLAPGTVGFWWFVPAAALDRAGVGVVGTAQLLASLLPEDLRDGHLARGGIATSDPAGATLTTWLLAAPRWAEVEAAARGLGARLGAIAPRISAAVAAE